MYLYKYVLKIEIKRNCKVTRGSIRDNKENVHKNTKL